MMTIRVLLIKFIYMFRIHMKQNINILLKKVKEVILNDWKIQSLLSNIPIIPRMSIKTRKSATQEKNVSYL